MIPIHGLSVGRSECSCCRESCGKREAGGRRSFSIFCTVLPDSVICIAPGTRGLSLLAIRGRRFAPCLLNVNMSNLLHRRKTFSNLCMHHGKPAILFWKTIRLAAVVIPLLWIMNP